MSGRNGFEADGKTEFTIEKKEKQSKEKRRKGQTGLRIKDWLSFFVGTGLMAAAVQLIYDPSHMVTGGFSSIGILVRNLTATEEFSGIPLGLTTFLLNIPVFIWGYKKKGLAFVEKSLISVLFLSLWLFVIPTITLEEEDLILASLFGGSLTGIGLGLVFQRDGSTGGTDMLAVLLHEYFPSYSTVFIMKLMDGAIVVLGAVYFGIARAMYAIVAVIVFSKISDSMLEGMKFARGVWIITDQKEPVTEVILHGLERGVTAWAAEGGYTKKGKWMLFCVVGKREIVKLRNLVQETDEAAFVIVGDAREVYGEGFLGRDGWPENG